MASPIPILGERPAKPSLERVFADEESPVLRFAYGLVGRREIAEDLVQEAFLKLHNQWETVDQPRPWLYRCVRNLALNHLRDHRRETLSSSFENDPAEFTASDKESPDTELRRFEAIGLVRLHLSEMTPEDRELIHLKYQEDLQYSQIGERTGNTVSNVGYRLHHLLKGLALSLKKSGIDTAQS